MAFRLWDFLYLGENRRIHTLYSDILTAHLQEGVTKATQIIM